MIYVCSKDAYIGHSRFMRNGHHYIDLSGGNVAVSAEFRDSYRENIFCSLSGCHALGPTSTAAQAALAAASLGVVGVTALDTYATIVQKLAAIHPLF